MAEAGSSSITISLEHATVFDKAQVWRRAVAKARAAERNPNRTDESLMAADQVVTETAHAIWRSGVRSWRDVELWAEMARDIAFDPADRALHADFLEAITKADKAVPIHLDMQSLAQLVKGVLELGGHQEVANA